MAMAVQDFEYSRPEEAELVVDSPMHLGGPTFLHMKMYKYRNLVVDFALNQFADAASMECGSETGNLDIARIDCCHSEIHQHQYYFSGKDDKRHVIQSLKGADCFETAAKLVNDHYDECYAKMVSNWERHFEVWKEG